MAYRIKCQEKLNDKNNQVLKLIKWQKIKWQKESNDEEKQKTK